MKRFLHPLLVAIALPLSFSACGKKAAPPAPAAIPVEAPAPEPVTYTLGEIQVAPLPADISLLGMEILVFQQVSEDAKSLLTRQDAILKALASPTKTVTPQNTSAADDLGISARDAERLTSELERLKQELPKPIETTFTATGSRRSYTSRQSLYAKFEPMVQKISLSDLEGTINPISKEMENVYNILKAEEESTPANSARVLQAKADIVWMAAFSDYMQGYRRVVMNFDSLRRRAAFQARRTGGATSNTRQPPASPEDQWKSFLTENGNKVEASLLRNCIGSSYQEKPGPFRVEGSGILAVRLDTSIGPIFLLNDNKLGWASFENITTETVDSAASTSGT